jgi:hypothetical protein
MRTLLLHAEVISIAPEGKLVLECSRESRETVNWDDNEVGEVKRWLCVIFEILERV